MDKHEFRKHAMEVVDYICNYFESIDGRRVFPDVEPGYLEPLMPKEAPILSEDWQSIMKDIDSKIMPGITHWQHPGFYAYFPNGNAYPSILAEMLSAGFGCVGFSWVSCPAYTELETIVLDWYGKALNLPPDFLFFTKGSKGGGVLQSSASDCILVCMLAARTKAIKYLMKKDQKEDALPSEYLPKLVGYCSKEAHSCVEKAALISLVRLRILDVEENGRLNTSILKEQIKRDIKEGLHPFFISTTIGTTGTCAFDNIYEVGQIANGLPSCWLHVDGAYGGNSFICPEMREPMHGIQFANSFNTNCNKWLLVANDCSCLWVKNRKELTSALVVDPIYLQHPNSKVTVDYRHWHIQLSRRFRSLKLWFTLRTYGISGLQSYIRNHCNLAKRFEGLIREDNRFEVCNQVKLGLVCFRLLGSDKLNQDLLANINKSGDLHMIPTMFHGKYIIRFCVTYEHAKPEHMDRAWEIIKKHAEDVLNKHATSSTHEELHERRKSRRLSFVRSMSREMYERRCSRNSLCDGAVPIPVIGDDGDFDVSDDDDDNDSYDNEVEH